MNDTQQWLLDRMNDENLTCFTCNQPCLSCSSYNITPKACNKSYLHCHRREHEAIRWCPVSGTMIIAGSRYRYCTNEMILKILLEDL